MAPSADTDVLLETVVENSLPGYGPVILMNRPMRTRLWSGVGAGGEIPPAIRLCDFIRNVSKVL